jgi:uncharacterized protein YaiE (UPF0345 family)
MFKTNEYFDGKVKSIAFRNEGQDATVGVMAPGDYVFNTADKETMSVITGAMTIKLADVPEHTYHAGESFDVPANCSFDIKVSTETAYLCLYG